MSHQQWEGLLGKVVSSPSPEVFKPSWITTLVFKAPSDADCQGGCWKNSSSERETKFQLLGLIQHQGSRKDETLRALPVLVPHTVTV